MKIKVFIFWRQVSTCVGVVCIPQQNIVPIVSQRSLCLDQHQLSTALAVSHLLQVVETGQECLSGGYVDLNPGTASSMSSTGSQQVSSYCYRHVCMSSLSVKQLPFVHLASLCMCDVLKICTS